MQRLAGKVALVTGGAGGIGSGIVERLAESGAKVVASDLRESAGRALEERLGCSGHEVVFIKHDVTQEESWAASIEAVLHRFQKLDVLVNAAGTFAKISQPIDDIPLEEWRRVQSINLESVFLGIRFGVAAMKKNRWRFDRQHCLDRRLYRYPDGGGLRSQQGRCPEFDEASRDQLRAAWLQDSGECHQSGLHLDTRYRSEPACGAWKSRCGAGGRCVTQSARACWQSGRCGLGDSVSCFR